MLKYLHQITRLNSSEYTLHYFPLITFWERDRFRSTKYLTEVVEKLTRTFVTLVWVRPDVFVLDIAIRGACRTQDWNRYSSSKSYGLLMRELPWNHPKCYLGVRLKVTFRQVPRTPWLTSEEFGRRYFGKMRKAWYFCHAFFNDVSSFHPKQTFCHQKCGVKEVGCRPWPYVVDSSPSLAPTPRTLSFTHQLLQLSNHDTHPLSVVRYGTVPGKYILPVPFLHQFAVEYSFSPSIFEHFTLILLGIFLSEKSSEKMTSPKTFRCAEYPFIHSQFILARIVFSTTISNITLHQWSPKRSSTNRPLWSMYLFS